MIRAFYIPNGPKNLQVMYPAIDFDNVKQYYVEVLDNTDTVIATSNINQTDGECCQDVFRVHFLNYLGAIDAINFKRLFKEHEAKSDSFRRTISHPLNKSSHAIGRFNVKANDIITLSCTDYPEKDMEWVNELIDSPLVWMQWTGIQGQDDNYIPITVDDAKMFNVKQDERYIYEVIIQVRPSHERFIIRN